MWALCGGGGAAQPESDYDFLVVEPEVDDRFKEMVRLSALLGSALILADVVVLTREAFERWRSEPNTLAGRASVTLYGQTRYEDALRH